MSGSLVNMDPQSGAGGMLPATIPEAGNNGVAADGGDIYAQFQQFFDWLASLPPLTEDQLLQLGAQAPVMGLYNQTQQQLIQQQQMDYQLKVLQQDFQLKGNELELAKLNLAFQMGPFQDYLDLKTANDMAMSNNQLGISGNELAMSRQQAKTSKEYTKQAYNNTAASAYGAKSAKFGADAAEFNYLSQKQQAMNKPWSAY
jgi:hypothetical protein